MSVNNARAEEGESKETPSESVGTNMGALIAAQLPDLKIAEANTAETTPEEDVKVKKPTMKKRLAIRMEKEGKVNTKLPTIRERVDAMEAENTAEKARVKLKLASEIPEPVENTAKGFEDTREEQPENIENAEDQEAAKETKELSFEDLLESAKTVDEKKALEEMSKQYSGKKLIVRKPIQGAGWEAQPRKEGEGPLTVEQSQQLCDELNASLKRLTPEKVETESNSKEELASLVAIIQDITDSEKLKEFSKRCAQKPNELLYGGKTEKGFWIKAIKGNKISEGLVEELNKRKAELAKSERLERIINEIRSTMENDELEKIAYTYDRLNILIKENIGARGYKVQAIEGVEGSKEIVGEIVKQKKLIGILNRQLKAIENTKSGPDLDGLAFELDKYSYLIKNGRGKNFTVKAGKRFGGEKLEQAVMAKKEEFVNVGLKASMGAIIAENIDK